MAAASLPELCLERIFKYLSNDLNSQYSCILINRYWCSSLISKLWENPFEFLKTKNNNSNLYLVNTYLICLPEDIQSFIGIQDVSKPSLFNYANFLRYISTQSIRNSVSKWAKRKDIKESPKFKTFLFNKENNQVPVESIDSITKILIEYFFVSSTYIKGIDQYLGRYLNVYKLPNAEAKLSQIQIFKCGADSFAGLVSYASRISRDIRQLEVRLKVKENSNIEGKSISLKDITKLIQSQRNLRHILIQYNPTFYSRNVIIDLWDNLMIHTESLVEIIFSKINFGFRFPLDCLVKFHNLRRLSFVDCEIENIYPLNFIPPLLEEFDHLADNPPLIEELQSFQKLESLFIRTSKIDIIKIEFLLQQASASLHSLELFNLDTLTNLEYFTHFFSNITRLTVGINMRWKIVTSIVKIANLLREIHIYDGRSNNFDDLSIHRKPMTADNFLCEIGRVMGENKYICLDLL